MQNEREIPEASTEIPSEVSTDVQLFIKRINSVMKHAPKDIQADEQGLLEISRMNRAQRRAVVAKMKKEKKR